MLEIRNVRKSFGGFTAVSDVSLTVQKQQIVAIIGPNGAGKSTFFNLITGHLRPNTGRILLDGNNITGIAPHKLCAMGMGRSFQRTNIFPRLTVFENIQAALIAYHGRGRDFWSRAAGLYRAETESLLSDVGLINKLNEMAGSLSHGNQKQLELGIALSSNPKILLLDEPTAGMSATETHASIDLLQRIASERELTLLFTEHDMRAVFSIAHRIGVLHQGRLIAEGLPNEVRNNDEVRRVYLGERH